MKKENGTPPGHTNRTGSQEKTLNDYIGMMLRGKWWILLIMILVVSIALYLTLQEEPVYQAETSVMLNTMSDTQPNIVPGFAGNAGRNIRNELEILKSRQLAEQVAKSLIERKYLSEETEDYIPVIAMYEEGRKVGVAPLGSITSRVQRQTSFEHLRDSDMILVRAQSRYPEEAALLSQTYAKIYYDRNHQTSRSHSKSLREFLEAQLRERERQLNQAEERLREYMEQHGVVTIDSESEKVINQLAALEARREELNVEIESRQQTMASVKTQLEEQEPGVAKRLGSTDDSYIRMLQEQMAQIELERDRVIAHNPDAVDQEQYKNRLSEIENRLNSLRATLDRRTEEYMRELTPGDEGYLRQLKQRLLEGEIELQGLELRKQATQQSIDEFERQFDQLPRMGMEFARLQRAQQSAEQLYLFIEQKYNEAMIAEQSEFGSVDIIDPALVPSSPISPDLQKNLMMAVIIGLGLGMGFVFMKEIMTGKINSPEELRKRGYNLLTIIGDMSSETRRASKRAALNINNNMIDAHIISIANPISPLSESYRWLRTNINFDLSDKQTKTLLVTSPNPGEGKSTTAANVAATYAQAGEQVLLIDTDIRRPSVHTMIGVSDQPGLTNVLFGEMGAMDAIQHTAIENFDILACGTSPHNPASIYGTRLGWLKMKALVDSLKERYDIIIFDSAPVLAATDPSVIASFVDGVIIVISSEDTKLKELDVTKETIDTVGGRMLGVVVNRFNYRNTYGNSYAGKYYNYGSYGQKKNGLNGKHSKKRVKNNA